MQTSALTSTQEMELSKLAAINVAAKVLNEAIAVNPDSAEDDVIVFMLAAAERMRTGKKFSELSHWFKA